MDPDSIKIGSFYKLLEPDWIKSIGQGDPPKCLTVVHRDKEYNMPWGIVFKASGTCDKENSIADMEVTPYPLIHINFLADHIGQFELISDK